MIFLNSKSIAENQIIIIVFRAITLCLFAYIALISSWISDDAMISFRQVLNFINGDGIVFNFGERVQAFTHPLWFFVLSGAYFLTEELFVTTSILSVIISVIAVIIMLRLEFKLVNGKPIFISPVFYLAFSFAFCDYLTSGLENPLSYLLVSLLFYLLFQKNVYKHLRFIFVILALLVLNRFDHSILFAPLTLVLLFDVKNKSLLISILLPGTLLLLAWIIFATFYFGSPLPNTFYAKLNAGYPKSEIFERGFGYIKSLRYDYASILILLLGFLSFFLYRNRILISLIFGKFLYMGYIVYIGGDFMLGRFYSILLFMSIGEILYASQKSGLSVKIKNYGSLVFLCIFCAIALYSGSPITSSTDYVKRVVRQGGIIDERGVNYHLTGIFSKYREKWPEVAVFNESPPEQYRIICGTIGAISLTDNSKFHIDPCALTDPLLSRIPAIRYPNWRIGHHFRKIPLEFGEYKIGKINELPDKKLNNLVENVYLVTQGDLFSISRIRAIWHYLTNSYSKLNFDQYINPNDWIPLTESVESIELESWESGIQVDDKPYWLTRIPKRSFNNNLKIESRLPLNTSIVWVRLGWGYTYDLYINSSKIYTLDRNSPHCPKGVKIYLDREHLIKSIEARAIDDLDTTHFGFNYIEFIKLKDSIDNESNFDPNCVVNL